MNYFFIDQIASSEKSLEVFKVKFYINFEFTYF